tara:strand:+ start:27 stop:659 length:633 start_codon:yes stop_codon:yes gene_type:complete
MGYSKNTSKAATALDYAQIDHYKRSTMAGLAGQTIDPLDMSVENISKFQYRGYDMKGDMYKNTSVSSAYGNYNVGANLGTGRGATSGSPDGWRAGGNPLRVVKLELGLDGLLTNDTNTTDMGNDINKIVPREDDSLLSTDGFKSRQDRDMKNLVGGAFEGKDIFENNQLTSRPSYNPADDFIAPRPDFDTPIDERINKNDKLGGLLTGLS